MRGLEKGCGVINSDNIEDSDCIKRSNFLAGIIALLCLCIFSRAVLLST